MSDLSKLILAPELLGPRKQPLLSNIKLKERWANDYMFAWIPYGDEGLFCGSYRRNSVTDANVTLSATESVLLQNGTYGHTVQHTGDAFVTGISWDSTALGFGSRVLIIPSTIFRNSSSRYIGGTDDGLYCNLTGWQLRVSAGFRATITDVVEGEPVYGGGYNGKYVLANNNTIVRNTQAYGTWDVADGLNVGSQAISLLVFFYNPATWPDTDSEIFEMLRDPYGFLFEPITSNVMPLYSAITQEQAEIIERLLTSQLSIDDVIVRQVLSSIPASVRTRVLIEYNRLVTGQ